MTHIEEKLSSLSSLGLGRGRRGLRSASPRRGRVAALTRILGAGLWAECSSEAAEINPPLGPYVHLTEADFADSSSFSTNTPLAATSYFYWYDIYSNAHILDGVLRSTRSRGRTASRRHLHGRR